MKTHYVGQALIVTYLWRYFNITAQSTFFAWHEIKAIILPINKENILFIRLIISSLNGEGLVHYDLFYCYMESWQPK